MRSARRHLILIAALSALVAVVFLLGKPAAEKPPEPLPATKVLQIQNEILYDFKAAIGAAKSMCENGENFLDRHNYHDHVINYNHLQAYLKHHGTAGPAEYPEKIKAYDLPGYTDWCKVQQTVTGLSCADDLD